MYCRGGGSQWGLMRIIMNRNSKFSTQKFIISLLFNIAVLLVALFVFRPFFEENDDSQICMIVEGVFGKREWHTIYVNVILGKLYVLLGSAMPLIRWHVVLQYAFIFIAYVSAMYILSKHKRGLYISIAAILATFYEMYVSIQYTKTAAFVCAVGFILLFEYVRNNTALTNANDTMISALSVNRVENTWLIGIAVVLIVYGALLRPESFFIAAVPGFATGLIELSRTKNIKRYIICLLPVFSVVLLLSFIDSYIYSQDEAWTKFMKYNKARMELNDYRYDILDYRKYADELTELGVSENDALAILTYQFGDDDVLSLERFLEIRAPFPNRQFGYMTFANLFENIVNEIPRSYTMLSGLFGIIIVLIASIVTDRSKSSPGFIKDSRRKMFLVLLMGLFCAAAIIYFQYSGRYSHRLIGAIVIPTIFFICYAIDSIYIKDNDSKIIFGGNKNDITMAAGIVMSIVFIGLNGLLYMANVSACQDNKAMYEPVLRELAEIGGDTESLYIADTFTFNDVYKYEVFNVLGEGTLSNYCNCGSWYMNSPITKAVTERYGYSNPFAALRSGNENVYLMDNGNTECKTLFLTEHYDKVYEAEMFEKRGGIDIYHVREKDL